MSIDRELRDLGHYRVRRAQEIALAGENDGISGALILAIASRETNMRNINSHGDGADRGVLQINSYWHRAFLASVPGCKVGSWTPTYGRTALDDGYCPRFTDSVTYAIGLLRDSIEYASDRGVPARDRVAFAIAAYNAGAGGAHAGYREGQIDKYTTGGNYSRDVLIRRTQINGSPVFKQWKVPA